MRAKSMVLILIALGCGLVASMAISQVMERGAKSANNLETAQIYVATADIDMNTQLAASNVRLEDWPKSKIPEGAVKDFDEINERFARVRFYAGEPILTPKLVNEIEGPAIKIPDGHRVCSLKVQMDTAVSGLVNPGDRVDIFGYFKEGSGIPQTGTREILKNVRVFAVNDQTAQEVDQEGRTIVAKTVSVLVKQEQVAKLMLATELGTLRLALRRPNEDSEDNRNETATVETLFGTRSETADEKTAAADNRLASAAGGFVHFLNNLKSQNTTAVTMPMPAPVAVVDEPARGPAWRMTILTPDGGTQFSWEDENGPPAVGDSSGASLQTQHATPVGPPVEPTPVDFPGTADGACDP
ncbi:MAG: Flp pilus assembly protein CpaB [Pirellulaceae bacterium]